MRAAAGALASERVARSCSVRPPSQLEDLVGVPVGVPAGEAAGVPLGDTPSQLKAPLVGDPTESQLDPEALA